MKFETREQVDEYLNADKIKCLICGKYFEFLGSHIRTHDISPREYREQFGLPLGTPLAGKGYREKHMEIMLEVRAEGKIENTPPEILKKIAPLAAKAFQVHKKRTKRKNIWKGSGKTLWGKRERAKEAAKLGDPEPLRKYLQEKELRKINKLKKIRSIGKLTPEVSKEVGLTQKVLMRLAKKIEVKRIDGCKGAYIWVEDDIKQLKKIVENRTRDFIPGLKTAADVAALTGMDENTIRRWAKKNGVHRYGDGSKKYFQFTDKDIEAFNSRKKRHGRISPHP